MDRSRDDPDESLDGRVQSLGRERLGQITRDAEFGEAEEKEWRRRAQSKADPLDSDIRAGFVGPSEGNESNPSFECQATARVQVRLPKADPGEHDPRCTTRSDHRDRLADEPHLVVQLGGDDLRDDILDGIHVTSLPGGAKRNARSGASEDLKFA